MSRNIDFFAVFFIALGLLAFSKLQAWEFPRAPRTVQVQRAVVPASDECPISEVASQVASLLNLP